LPARWASAYSLSHMYLRRAVAMAAALGALTATGRASAWQEAHQTGGDVDIHVDPDGGASLHERVRWHVVRGPVHWVDLDNVEATAVLDPAVAITSEDGRPATAHLDRRDDHAIRVTVDDPRSMMRGDFTFDVRWRVDWVKSGAIAREGASWRISWSSPLASDGLDLVRTTLDLPAAREVPVIILGDTGAVDDSALSSLRREPSRDVLEMVRPHVGRGESVAWTVRIDPGALPGVVDPRLRPAPPPPPPEPDRVREVSWIGSLVALAIGFGILVARKGRAFASACAARGVQARSIVGLPDELRAVLAGLGLAAGVGLQSLGALTAGSSLVAIAVLAAASRPPRARLPARGPGRWLALRPDEAFASPGGPPSGHWLDTSTRPGRRGAWLAGILAILLAVAARHFSAQAAWLVALDASALVPLFATGRAADLSPDGARGAAPWLAPVFQRLRAIPSLRVAPWARVVLGGATVDELRLLVLPRVVMPGVVGIEIGRAWSTTPAGWAATPEVLVRVLEGSSAAAKLAQVLPRARSLPGRRADERVVRLRPRAGTRASTIALTRGLVDAVTDRRAPASADAWEGLTERRSARPVAPPAGPPIEAAKAC
jgi:hypothetical protein